MIPTRFTAEDGARANEEWGANCGPGALAAILGLTLDQVRPMLAGFDTKHYVNPTMMFDALTRSGTRWSTKVGAALVFPSYGLARIQWEGPWSAPEVPKRVGYRYTHWVGAKRGATSTGIFDINAMANGTGWCSIEDWSSTIAPYILEAYPRANGKWHITHAIEVPEPMPHDLLMTG